MSLISLLSIQIFVLLLPPAAFPIENAAKNFYQHGLELKRQGHTRAAITAFEQAVGEDHNFAEAYHELGLTYADLGTVHARMKATRALKQAIRLDAGNVLYQLDMAKLALRKEMRGEANAYFKRVLNLDPLNAEAHYRLGLYEEENMLWFKDLINPKEHIIIKFDDEAQKRTRQARSHYRKAILGNPDFKLPYYHLAFIDFELGQYDSMIVFVEKALRQHPNDKDFYLFRGLAYHRKNMFITAQRSFDKARALMSPEELAQVESLHPVLSPSAEARYAELKGRGKAAFEAAFWKQRDPLFLTRFNERLLEHFTRLAYVNMRYGDPEKGIDGWRTDQGKTYMRFGPPKLKYRTRPSADASFQRASMTNERPWLNSSKESWEYNGFKITFEDEFVRRKFKFQRTFNPDADSKLRYDHLVETQPEIYDADLGRTRFDIPIVLTQFRGQNGATRIELFYGLTTNRITLFQYDDVVKVKVRQGFFLFDDNWNELHRDVKLSHRSLANGRKTTGEVVKLDRFQTEVSPGRYNMAFEIMDEDSRNFASVKDTLIVEDFSGGKLALSGILLASDVAPDTSTSPYRFGDLRVLPNLAQSFAVDTLVFTYFELYNLTLDRDGASRYDIETTVHPIGEEGVLSRFAAKLTSLFGSSNTKSGEVSITHEYFGSSHSERIYNAFQMKGAPAGRYRLQIKVTDRLAATSAIKGINFTLF